MAGEAKLPRSRSGSPDRAPRAAATKDAPGGTSSKDTRSGKSQRARSRSADGNAAANKLGKGLMAKLAGGNSDEPDKPTISAGAGMWSKVSKTHGPGMGNLQSAVSKEMKDTLTFDALFKRYELAKAFSLDSAQVRHDATRVKKRLQDANRFLLNSESKAMQMWDLGTVIALVFTLLVSPYEIGYLDGYQGSGALVLAWINHFVSIIFAIDLVLNFFRPYRDALSQKVKSHRKIAWAYLKGWFIIDVSSTVPFDTIADLINSFDTAAQEAGPNPQLKMIRLLRLLKLFRIVRASRVFARLADRIEHYISISHSNRTLLAWTIMLLTVVHWFICCWGLLAQLHGTQRTPELTLAVSLDAECMDSGACLPTDHPTSPQCVHPCLTECELRLLSDMNAWSSKLVFNQENWVCRAEANGIVLPSSPEAMKNAKGAMDLARVYRYASIAHIFGQMPPTNLTEYIMGYLLAFGWLMMQNAFIGILCGSIADGDRHAKEYKQRMDELNYFLRDMQAPPELAMRARAHCRSTRGLFKKYEYVKLFKIMSPMLRGDLAQIMSLRTLENVWYFKSVEAELLRAMSEKLKPIGFARGEKIYHEPRINIVTKGAAARGGKILTLDCYWGEDMIVTSEALKDTRYASALTYLELTTVSREDLEDCLINYPKSERVIRVTALKMAMQRAGQIIAHHLQTRLKAKQLSSALSRFDPRNQMLANHAQASDSNESILREMMVLVNGGKKLRVFDEKVGAIVDESETIINDDYVRSVQQQYRISTEQHLLKIQEDLGNLRSEQHKAMEYERQQIAAERAAMATERELFKKIALLGKDGALPPGAASALGGKGGGKSGGPGASLGKASAFSSLGKMGAGASLSKLAAKDDPRGRSRSPANRGPSPAGTATPLDRPDSRLAGAMASGGAPRDAAAMLAAAGAGGSVKCVDGVLMEKRYRRKKRGGAPTPPPGGPSPDGDVDDQDSPDGGPDLSA